MGEDFVSVNVDSQVREVFVLVFESAEGAAGIKESFEDGLAGLHVDLAPFLAFGVPEFQCHDAGSCH